MRKGDPQEGESPKVELGFVRDGPRYRDGRRNAGWDIPKAKPVSWTSPKRDGRALNAREIANHQKHRVKRLRRDHGG
jgi:hypothetical protein